LGCARVQGRILIYIIDMNNKEKLYLAKQAAGGFLKIATQQFQNKYDANDQASMLEAYNSRGNSRGIDNQNMSYTPPVDTAANFGFDNKQDFARASSLTGVMRAGNLTKNRERIDPNYKSPWKGVSPQMTNGVMNMRRSVHSTGAPEATSGFKQQFQAPETQTRYNRNQPGGNNYYHGLHALNTDKHGDTNFSSPPLRGNANFPKGAEGDDLFNQALNKHEDGTTFYDSETGSFDQPNILDQRLQENRGDLGGTDYLTQRLNETGMKSTLPGTPIPLNETGMKSTLPGTPIPPSQPNTSSTPIAKVGTPSQSNQT
jgi:hypothetical protein